MQVNSHLGPNSLMVEFVDFDKALDDFQQLTRDRDAALWAMGDIADRLLRAIGSSEQIRRAFRQQGVTITGFARQVGVPPSRLKQMAVASRTFRPKERHPHLSWEHHLVVALALPDESQTVRKRWLKDAHKHHWTAQQLKRRLASTRAPLRDLTAEERVERLRRRLAEAEAELSLRRQDRTSGR